MMRHLAGCDLLVVEDEFLILLDLCTILEDQGARVTTASSVADGLAAARADRNFAAALLDVRLPDGDVFPVAEELVKRDVPLVFHSGHAQSGELKERFPNAIALSKPAAERVLIDAMVRTARANGRSETDD